MEESNFDISGPEGVQIKNDKFKCADCDRLFEDVVNLELHIKTDCINTIYDHKYEIDIKKSGKEIFKEIKTAGDIYIITANRFIDRQFYKIGITENLKKRLSVYNTGNVSGYNIYYIFPCKDIRKAEKEISDKLKEYCAKREIYEKNQTTIKMLRGELCKVKYINTSLSDICNSTFEIVANKKNNLEEEFEA